MSTKPTLVHTDLSQIATMYDAFAAEQPELMLEKVRELRHVLDRIEYSLNEKSF
jgi:hypothetical protein